MNPFTDEQQLDRDAAGQVTNPEPDQNALALERMDSLTAEIGEVAAALLALGEETQRVGEHLDQLIDAAIGEMGKTAGGQVGTATSEGGYVSGHPWATGDVRLTCNRGTAAIGQPAIPPAGWLVCNGTYVRKDAFPELFWALGGGFDAAAGVDVFKLPVAADLPTVPSSKFFWIVRT